MRVFILFYFLYFKASVSAVSLGVFQSTSLKSAAATVTWRPATLPRTHAYSVGLCPYRLLASRPSVRAADTLFIRKPLKVLNSLVWWRHSQTDAPRLTRSDFIASRTIPSARYAAFSRRKTPPLVRSVWTGLLLKNTRSSATAEKQRVSCPRGGG